MKHNTYSELPPTRCPNVLRAISEPISSPMAMRAMPRTATPYDVKMTIMSTYISNKGARTQKGKNRCLGQMWRPLPGGSPCLQETPSYLCPSYLSCPCPPPSLSPLLHSAHCRYAEAAGLSVHFQNLRCKRWDVDLLRDWSKQAKGELVSIIMGFYTETNHYNNDNLED